MKVGIYCRLSEEDRDKRLQTDDSVSIQNQKSMLTQYAWEKGWDIYSIYSDDDYTGSDRKRPEFNRLIRDAEARKFDIILCKSQSRFTRELELVEHYIHDMFPRWGIRFVSVVDNADTDVKGNKKSRQINGLINEWFLEDMSDNIRSVLTNRRVNGYHIGAFALYGYMKDPDQKGHLIIDEEAAAVVREVFTLYSQGVGKTAIARILNDRGIPNPTEYKRQKGLRYMQPKNKNSTLWKYFAVSDMLTNEIYIGNMVQGKYGSISYKTKQCKPRPKDKWYVVEGTHEPIIDRELWDRVQELVAQRAKPFDNGQIGIFAKKVRCAECGYIMRSNKRSSDHRYLQCGTRFISKDACGGAFIPVSVLEDAVLCELAKLSEEYLDKDELARSIEFSEGLTAQKEQLSAEIGKYNKKIADLSKGLRNLYLDKVKEIITDNDFADLSRELRYEKEQCESVISELNIKVEKIEEKLSAGEDKRKLIESYINVKQLDRETVDALVDHIEVGRRKSRSDKYPVTIYWNF